MSRRGFTLLDVVITTMVIGILASAGALKYVDTLRHFNAEAAAKRIATDFEYARWQARTRAAAETVVFDLADHRYTLSSAVDLAHPTEIYTVRLQEHPYEARLVSVDFAGGTVTFNTYGLPDTGGDIVVASGSHQKTIHLDAGSGRAAIQP
jgi:prepilin-type N-terminal cleavage/methylation domain-containing protein